MDYGPYLTASIEVPGSRTNIAYKGLAIRLNGLTFGTNQNAVLFDTDLLRYAAGWTGEYVALKGVVFDGEHWAYPRIAGETVFENQASPGWARHGSFVDPRREPYGPLPRAWGQWQGLHLHGDQVILAYSVGGVAVREMPSVLEWRGQKSWARVVERSASTNHDVMLVATVPGARLRVRQRGELTPAAQDVPAHLAWVLVADPDRPASVLAIAAQGTPEGSRWILSAKGEVGLSLPPAETEMRYRVLVWRGAESHLPLFAELISRSPMPLHLGTLTRGGPPRWPEVLATQGKLGAGEGAYVIDSLPPPEDNPWHSWLRFGGLDFFADGRRAALCTWNGDVWTVDGIDQRLAQLNWRRIAAGLFQPLGLKIVNDQIYVLGRDQITRLHDLNGDGEADFYEAFNHDALVSEHFHEFATDLKTDAAGNFYYIKCARHALPAAHSQHGTLIQVSPDGTRSEIVARGFRAVNGLGVGPGGELMCVDNQGHWMPGNRINWVKPGGFYGNLWAWQDPPRRNDYDLPLCWMHNFVDRSGGTHLWAPLEGWGPAGGKIITLSYGMGHMFLLLKEEVDGIMQGGVTRFPLEFDTGVMRGVFHPQDRQLYACGLYGWAGNKTRPGGVYRVRYTGRPAHLPGELKVARDGLVIRFTDPLDADTALDAGNYDVQAWNYRWTEQYGSPDLKLDGQEGRDRWPVTGVEMSADQRAVFLRIPSLQPAMQVHVNFRLRSVSGARVENFVHHTIHRLGTQGGTEMLGPNVLARAGASGTTAAAQALGLIQSISHSPATEPPGEDVRLVRTASLLVPAGTPPSAAVPPGPFLSTWEGALLLELNDERAFRLEGTGSATLRLNGQLILEGSLEPTNDLSSPRIKLRRGANALLLTYRSPRQGDAQCRLLWSSADLPWEPVPPVALGHESVGEVLAQRVLQREGRSLFAALRCARCHEPETPRAALAMPELQADAPAFDRLGSRLELAWLQRYLAGPAKMRSDVTMPSMLRGKPEEVARDARDLAAYLTSLKADRPGNAAATSAFVEAAVAQGRSLYDRLGCLACHRLAGEGALPDDQRLSLEQVPAKFLPGVLADFLRRPSADYRWIRMPDFKLSEAESVALEAWLRQQPNQSPETPTVDGPTGQEHRGRELVLNLGCLACHTLGGVTNQMPAAPRLAVLAQGHVDRGCLAETEPTTGLAPHYHLTTTQRIALRTFLRTDPLSKLDHDAASEFAERQFAASRCNACHGRDEKPDYWSVVTAARTSSAADSTGTAPADDAEEETSVSSVHLGRPDLTYAGEKLQGSWMRRFISGTLPYKPRPESQGRMPAFPAHGDLLGAGLAHQHGLSAAEAPRPQAQTALAQVGQRLTLVGDGFGCVACHDVGDQRALAGADTATINFAYIADRLRPEYFWRYIRDPQRFRPGTMMPNFIAEDGLSPIAGFFDGDAHRQFEALWHYLLSLRPTPAP
jgi:cytochrome c553